MDEERPDMIMLAGIVTFLVVSGSVVFFLFAAFIGPEKMAEAWDVHQNIGMTAAHKQDWITAEKRFREALRCAERASSIDRMAESQFALGVSLQMQGRTDESRRVLERALSAFNNLDDGRGPLVAGGDPIATKEVKCMLLLAEMDLASGRSASAHRWLDSAGEVRKRRFVPLELGFKLRSTRARLFRREGKAAEALELEKQLPEEVRMEPL